jgi:putative peptidoglycan lipid II flippase
VNAYGRLLRPAHRLAARMIVSADQRRVIMAAALVGTLTLGVKIAALLREMLVAARLGTSDVVEAYIIAWAFPGFIAQIVSNAIVGALLPLHAAARARRGDDEGNRVFAEVTLIHISVLALVTAVLALTPGALLPLLAADFDAEKTALAEHLWRLMLPNVFVTGIIALWSGMLNAGNRFGLAAASPAVVPVVSGAMLLALPSRPADALALGFLLGNLTQLAMLAIELRRHQIRLIPGWFGGLPETRQLHRQFFPLIANGVVFGGLVLVDQAMAATLGDRNVAVLSYANKLVLPILGISSAALATAVLPYFSRLAAEDDWQTLRQALRVYTRLIAAVAVPVTVAIVVLSEPIVRGLFQRGEFSAADTADVAAVQATFALAIPFYTIAVLYSRVVVSLRLSHVMLIGSTAVFLINVIGDYLLKGWIGVQGIALASVINYVVQCTYLALVVRWHWRKHEQRVASAEEVELRAKEGAT